MAAANGRSNEIQGLGPLQIRVVELRLLGRRWIQIAAELNVTPWTVWHWRQVHPEIDELIRSEACDRLEASAIKLGNLIPKALRALEREMRRPDPEGGKIRVAAARAILAQVRRSEARSEVATREIRPLAGLSDDQLASAYLAAAAEEGESEGGA